MATTEHDPNQLAALLTARKLPPVHQWNPEFCGDMDMRIARDGTWFYMGSPIGRKKLVELFSTVLRRDADDEFYLVTPVERLRIRVDDAPFVAVQVDCINPGKDQELLFRTNVGDIVKADDDNPIKVVTDPETLEPSPYVLVRDRLEALIARPVFYELVERAEERIHNGITELGIYSCGEFFSLGKL